MTYREGSTSNNKNLTDKDTHGSSNKEYSISSDGNRVEGGGTYLNGMFRGDCKNCDHLGCDQCNWQEQK